MLIKLINFRYIDKRYKVIKFKIQNLITKIFSIYTREELIRNIVEDPTTVFLLIVLQ